MMELVAIERIGKCADHMRLSDQIIEGLGAPFAGEHLVGHALFELDEFRMGRTIARVETVIPAFPRTANCRWSPSVPATSRL
jgi:hypothetical protein